MCTKTLQNFSEKFSLFTLCLSMVSSSCHFYAFSEILLLEKRGEKGEAKKKIKLICAHVRKRKRRSEKNRTDLCACTRKKVVKHDSYEKQERILHFKGRFEWFRA